LYLPALSVTVSVVVAFEMVFVLPSSCSPFSTLTLCLSADRLRKMILIFPARAWTVFWS